MSLETRVWGSKSTPNLFTTIPVAVRRQLHISADDQVAWRLEGSFAEVRRHTGEPSTNGKDGYTVYKQARSNSLYTAIPVAVIEQLRLRARDRAAWELHGDKAHLRRG
ncbi:MAG TPA: hypothetical protein VM889_10170 [Candidatus Thermoplasmatota archaeon]|nr:hypothetical protein [Candidatus Thermoplasmatota archaeon]